MAVSHDNAKDRTHSIAIDEILAEIRPYALAVRSACRVSAGIWNAHTSVGNILGSAAAAACLSWGWGWAFLIPGSALACTGIIIWLFLVVEPEEAGLMKMKDSLVVRPRSCPSHRPSKASCLPESCAQV
jgi:MFS family permease